jgi:hypothetical protein
MQSFEIRPPKSPEGGLWAGASLAEFCHFFSSPPAGGRLEGVVIQTKGITCTLNVNG